MKKYVIFTPTPEISKTIQDQLVSAGFKLADGEYYLECQFIQIKNNEIWHIENFVDASRDIKGGIIPLNYNNFDPFELDGAKPPEKMIKVDGKEYSESTLKKMIQQYTT